MSPSRRIARALRRSDRIEDAAARAQLRLLRELRRAVLAGIVDATGFRFDHLTRLLQTIDQEIRRYRPLAEEAARRATREMFTAGAAMVEDLVGVLSQGNLGGLSAQLLDAAIDVTTDSVRGIWNELGGRLKTQVRHAALGVTDPLTAMQQVARVIKNPKTFGTAMNRAEAIIRTEVNRTFSLATHSRMKQANEAMGGTLQKYWLTAEDARVRPDHETAGEVYDIDGAIPVEEAFIVGGEELMFPRDPGASAAQTVNCRCRSVPFVQTEENAAAA